MIAIVPLYIFTISVRASSERLVNGQPRWAVLYLLIIKSSLMPPQEIITFYRLYLFET